VGLTVKTRASEKNAIYIPKAIAEAAGLREGRMVIEVALDPFDLALREMKFAETTLEEFERESEEMQSELFKE